MEKRIKVKVRSKGGETTFVAKIHYIKSRRELNLNPESYYHVRGNSPLEFPHHEIQISEPDVKLLTSYELNIERSDSTDGHFVGHPTRIATIEEAALIFKVWAVGFVMKTLKPDFKVNEVLMRECSGDFQFFLNVLCAKGVYVINVSFMEDEPVIQH